MLKPKQTVQLALTGFITFISTELRSLCPLILCLLVLMVIDYGTGMLASKKEAIEHPSDSSYGWNSRKGALGILRKVGYWGIIVSAFSMDCILQRAAAQLSLSYPQKAYLGTLVLVWYSLNELLSITENAGRMGAPIPGRLKEYISDLKDKLDES